MSTYKRTLLCCAITACGINSAHSVASSVFDSFIDDTSMDGKLRTVYYDIHNTEKDSTSGAWTEALWLNFQSGYLGDVFALGGTFYGDTKLYMSENNTDSYQLLIDEYETMNGAKTRKSSDGFGKIGQAWVDLKLPSSIKNASGHFQAGRQIVYTGLISSSGSRSVESTWRGYKIDGSSYGLGFGLAYVDQMSLRNQSGFHELTNFNGKQIDNIIGGELTYTFELAHQRSLRLRYRNAYAKDFLQAHNGDIQFNTPLTDNIELSVGGKYYKVKNDGNLWDGSAWGKPAFDDDASVYNLYFSMDVNSWNVRAGVSHYDAKSTSPDTSNVEKTGYIRPGSYFYDLGKNTHGIWDIGTSGFAEDMLYDGETVWMAGVSYNFSNIGIQGLKLGYAFHYGSGMEVTEAKTGKKSSTSEFENDIHIIYDFPQQKLRGLSFKLKYGIYKNDEQLRKAITKEENDLRVWLDYDFLLF
ncbi:hypothetical protein ACH42_07825 [Endozoicomonas sp. (ex Bugula neritina AB1)]|nr:hypothetical protein ACH42_07825 [Endozoicomonas sp. (ex Bugula neritina AB1)]